jgi:eukaryotic-like serine/threonine-protein kinase
LAFVVVRQELWHRTAANAPVRMNATLDVDTELATGVGNMMQAGSLGSAAILSPDGRTFAFVAQRRAGPPALYIRRLAEVDATRLAGTDGATSPFFSPDGEWIAFFADGKLKKVALSGGAAITLCDAPDGRGGAWADDGWIAVAPNTSGGLVRVSSNGGTPTALTALADDEVTERWPQILPGGRAVLYTGNTTRTNFDDATLVVQPLPRGPRKIIQHGGFYGRYLSSGHIVYLHGGTLFAVPFDLKRLEVSGPPAVALSGVASNPNGGGAQIAASESGTIVYQVGPTGAAAASGGPIEWMDRAGRRSPLRPTPANWGNPQFSPDGARLAIEINDGKQLGIWAYEWTHDTSRRLTLDTATNQKPIWTPDGRRIVFWSNRDHVQNLYWQRADGSGDVHRLTRSQYPQSAASFHPSAHILAFQETRPQTGADLMLLPIDGDETRGWSPGTATVFLSTPASEQEPMFSPDGRWLAYQSNDTGRFEVYVRPYPGPGGTWLISSAGGRTPTWSRARRELVYRTPENQLMAVGYSVSGDSFRAEKPRLWGAGRIGQQTGQRSFDLHPDGERVAVAPDPAEAGGQRNQVAFVFNFFEELRRIAAGATR